MVALEHFLANIARIGAQAPFVHAPVRAESEPAFRDLKIAPAAQVAPVYPFGEIAAIGPSAWHCSLRTHLAYDNHLKTSESLFHTGGAADSREAFWGMPVHFRGNKSTLVDI